MTKEQKEIILDAWAWCDEHDKSTEFMLQYLSDTSSVNYDEIVDYVASDESEKDRVKYYKKLLKL